MPRKKETPDASASGLATVTGEPFDFEAARAKSVLASARMVEIIDQAERMSVGSWYFPDGWPDERMKNWHFIRCGLLVSEAALALAGQLRQYGYMPAPRGVRCVGFESSGENMLVMCAPREAQQNMRHAKNLEKARIGRGLKDSFGDVQAAVGSRGDVRVEGGAGKGSEGDLRDAMRGASSIL